MLTRREFLRCTVRVARGVAITAVPLAAAAQTLRRKSVPVQPVKLKVRWVFLIDTTRCTGCGLCVEACRLENELPLDITPSRTWIERYVVTRDGKTHADSPRAAVHGFTDDRIQIGERKYERIDPADIQKAFFIPKLCNQCENPPCVQVCPVGATYQTEEGVVLVDRKTCIGCGYCVMACPYGARFFHPKYRVAEKCTFCYHRLSRGQKPACVEICPFGARAVGNILDPNDPVTKVIATDRVQVLKDEYGCKPQVYYIGLSKEVR